MLLFVRNIRSVFVFFFVVDQLNVSYPAQRMMMETVQLYQFEHAFLCTSHFHVFCEHKQYHQPLILIQIHYLEDMRRCI